MKRIDMVLVSMPFGPLLEPSLGLSLLKVKLASHGFKAKILYLTLPFAHELGLGPYSALAAGAPHSTALAGEWIFASDLEEADTLETEQYVEHILRGNLEPYPSFVTGRQPVTDEFVAGVLRARTLVPSFLAAAAQQVLSVDAPIVGFTSVFQQQLASLALAKRLKVAAPELTIVFGGANCEGAMGAEMLRRFHFIDAVVSGEGEEIIVPLVERLLAGSPYAGLPGVYTRSSVSAGVTQHDRLEFPNAPSVRSLDSLPYPSFDDFFEQINAVDMGDVPESRLLFESARGCWWGEKHHCTFCGLNGATMTFRSKSAGRVLTELMHLTKSYPGKAVSFVDNILDMNYFRDLLPALAERAVKLDLFFEVKANLRRDQVRLLREAGITQIQPGIESLSTEVLARMCKGVTALQNIQLLKWCKEFGIKPHWNFLWGFPGEDPEEYRRMAELIPAIYHLPPPNGGALIRLDRFSPHFIDAEAFGFDQVQPCPAYGYVYPKIAAGSLSRLAYYFAFKYKQPQPVVDYVGPVAEEIGRWRELYERSDLFFVDKDGRLLVWDFRPAARDTLSILDGLYRAVLLACDVARSAEKIAMRVDDNFGVLSTARVEEVLESLRERGLVIAEGGRWLGLAIRLGEYSPGPEVVKQFLEATRSMGRAQGPTTILPSATVERSRVG